MEVAGSPQCIAKMGLARRRLASTLDALWAQKRVDHNSRLIVPLFDLPLKPALLNNDVTRAALRTLHQKPNVFVGIFHELT
jgi:hypothetical protein